MARIVFDAGVGSGADGNSLSVGVATHSRMIPWASTASTSGALRLSFFTSSASLLAGNIRMGTGGVAAAATPTLCRMGLYSVAANGDLTLIGSTANDTSLFSATNSSYTRALSTPVQLNAGSRYAAGALVVSAATMPALVGYAAGVNSAAQELAMAPRLSGNVTALADLPALILNGDLATSQQSSYVVLTP